ncbi:hypothetical protein I6I78_16785 (plasmid) [Enterococcus casseliflavus]|uniref:hypothetical protein n=1 Tax=Enterococcus casseliflavus TaxID=37734 RepID=UPI001918F319|nr:hypothetical protein [Enterococcus casseliflavus]QQU21377.1 hypothetical protein I6I78_16785 [Enterococcus casseliflavus]
MSFSAYVDSYPVTAYIVGHLGLSVGDFCRRYEFDPTIVSGWQTANRSVFSLPADFVECLAIASDKTAEQVRCILRLLEKQHFAYLAKNPAWNITPSLLAPPVSSQTTQREEA